MDMYLLTLLCSHCMQISRCPNAPLAFDTCCWIHVDFSIEYCLLYVCMVPGPLMGAQDLHETIDNRGRLSMEMKLPMQTVSNPHTAAAAPRGDLI